MEDINALPDQLNESRDQGDNSLMTVRGVNSVMRRKAEALANDHRI